MKHILFFTLLAFTQISNVNAQTFAFIGENSYPSTEKYTLQSNSDKESINDLAVVFAKEETKGLIILSSKLSNSVKISGKLIIYLEDGSVISCIDRGINDNVDEVATSAYYLTNKELNKLKKSNINKIRYQIECPVCGPYNSWEGIYSASNKGNSKTDFTTVITEFYKY